MDISPHPVQLKPPAVSEQPVPLILPRHEHSLSRQNVDPEALKVLYRLHHHGFRAYLVGGCVRDLLLGKSPKDFDVVTDAHPQQVRELFRNSRLIGRRFRLVQVFFPGGKIVEVSTFRRRSEFEGGDNGEPPSENTFGTPAEDAFRRDITINGIFYDIADFSLLDYVGGLEDLRRGLIRCIGDPEEKFSQDPVRMIRVIRHAARTGFAIEGETHRSLRGQVEKLRLCSPARVRDEFLRELREGSARRSMELMIETGMLFALFPSFRPFLEGSDRKDLLFRTASRIDAFHRSGNPMGEDFLLALFLSPFMEELSFSAGNSFVNRRERGPRHQRLREWVRETVGPLHFTRYALESAAHLLSTQALFHELLPGGKLPQRLRRKAYFAQARLLFEIRAEANDEDPSELFRPEPEDQPASRRRRKRGRRRPRPAPKSGRLAEAGGNPRKEDEGLARVPLP